MASQARNNEEFPAARGCLTLEQLGLKVPRVVTDLPIADVHAQASYNSVLDESHTGLTLQGRCERAWYLGSGLEPSIDQREHHILRSLSSYIGALGTVVHEGIRRVLDAQRERLSHDGRVLKAQTPYDLDQILKSITERFRYMEQHSWAEFFPNGRADRDHPRFIEHLKIKHQLVAGESPQLVNLQEKSPDQHTFVRLEEEALQAFKNWHELVYLDKQDIFKDDPRQIVPIGGLAKIDPLLIIELEEKNVSYVKHDSFEILGLGGVSIPYYEIEVPIEHPPIDKLSRNDLSARFTFRVKTVLDLAYLTFTPEGAPRLVAMDWKTNRLDSFSGAPSFAAAEEHLTQLKHYAVYLLQRYKDVFQRFAPEIKRAFERAHRTMPKLPNELSADMVYLGDLYLYGEELSTPYRFKPICAADMDLDLFVDNLRTRMAAKVEKFTNIDPPVSSLQAWAPTGLENNVCQRCNQAPLCPDASAEIRKEWPVSSADMLAQLRHPRRIPLS